MNITEARKIAERITNEQIQEMFNRAKTEITDWTQISNINRGMTKGTGWNILASNFDVNSKYSKVAKMNMVREFGEFLPSELRIPRLTRKSSDIPPVHQDPKF